MSNNWYREAILTSVPNRPFQDLQMDFGSFVARGRVIPVETGGFIVCTTNHRPDEQPRDFRPYKLATYAGEAVQSLVEAMFANLEKENALGRVPYTLINRTEYSAPERFRTPVFNNSEVH